MAIDLVTVGIVCADVMVRPLDTYPERGKLVFARHLELHLGGLAGVTATVFCQLGGKAAFIGRLGQDGFGDYVFNTMKSQGVNLDKVQRTTEHGTSATVVLISRDGERTFIHHMGTNAVTSEQDIDLDFVRQAKMLHWGGPSVTPRLDGEPIGRVFKKARALGVKTSIDTCFDGRDIWFPHIEHALPNLDIVMSSLEEARHYTGRQNPEDIADFYLSFGPEIVMIKLGSEGVLVKNATQCHRIPAHKVRVVDTTGAGDASCAGFLFGYLQGWDLLRCGRLANAVGGLTVQQMGGAEAIGSLEQVLEFMEKA